MRNKDDGSLLGIGQLSLQAEIRHQHFCNVIDVLCINPISRVCIGIVAPGVNAGIGYLAREKISQPQLAAV